LRLAHYLIGGQVRVGVVKEDTHTLHDLSESSTSAGAEPVPADATIDSLLVAGRLDVLVESADRLTTGKGIPLSGLSLKPPVLSPEKILLVAVNYHSHSKEQNIQPPQSPYFFTKFRNALVGPDEPIIIPRVSSKVDWEVELAVIIGRGGKYIGREEAGDHVAGYAVANDVSFRDLQYPPGWPERLSPLGMNWVKGKALDSSLPLGPWLVTRDEVPDPQDLRLRLRVNGETKQDSSTSDMIFDIGRLIEYASAGITLRPGDVISTGTPLGVSLWGEQRFLAEGDVVEAEVEGIGILRNPVRREM
jgi:2-keto-4-pentenoate hydratase/2-oxohepta-3-ene-1,7-dioic acid hydratase in catechol pathway